MCMVFRMQNPHLVQRSHPRPKSKHEFASTTPRPRASSTHSHFRAGRVFTSSDPTQKLDSLLDSSTQPHSPPRTHLSSPNPRPRSNSTRPTPFPCLPCQSPAPSLLDCSRFSAKLDKPATITPRFSRQTSLTDLKNYPPQPFKVSRKRSSPNLNFNLFSFSRFLPNVSPTHHYDKSSDGSSDILKSPEIHHLIPPSSLPTTWQSSLSQETFLKLKERFGPTEIKRQEIIWELIQTEARYLEDLKTIIALFSHSSLHHTRSNPDQGPLTRLPRIDEIPPHFVQLVQNVYQIFILHQSIHISQQQSQKLNHGLVILRISQSYLPVMHRLKGVYQEYLIRFEEANKLIEKVLKIDSMRTPSAKGNRKKSGTFGSSVGHQSGSDQLVQLRLNSFLLKPVQRLMKYPLFFKQLCDLTPPLHPDHLPTLNLWRSVDELIKELEELKNAQEREDDENFTLEPLKTRTRQLAPNKLSLGRMGKQSVGLPTHSPAEFNTLPTSKKILYSAAYHESPSETCPPSHYTRSSELRNPLSPVYKTPSHSPISEEFGAICSIIKTKFTSVSSISNLRSY